MQSAPEMYQLAASFDWEALLPVLFFLLYGISQLFGNKKKKPQEEEEAPDVDAMERARQIREEIRRKIEERRGAAGGGGSSPGYDPTIPESQQRKPRPQQRTPQQPVRKPQPQPQHQSRSQTRMMQQKAGIEKRLEEQRRVLAEAQRKAKEAQERAALVAQSGRGRQMQAIRQRAADAIHVKVSGKSFRENIIFGLRNPASARQAILFQEILEKPVGLR